MPSQCEVTSTVVGLPLGFESLKQNKGRTLGSCSCPVSGSGPAASSCPLSYSCPASGSCPPSCSCSVSGSGPASCSCSPSTSCPPSLCPDFSVYACGVVKKMQPCQRTPPPGVMQGVCGELLQSFDLLIDVTELVINFVVHPVKFQIEPVGLFINLVIDQIHFVIKSILSSALSNF